MERRNCQNTPGDIDMGSSLFQAYIITCLINGKRYIGITARGRGRFLCWVLPHSWHYTHLFDDGPDYSIPFRGASNYAGICLRCGKRDLFRGALRRPQEKADG
jgi:hypothetical protein